MTHPREARTCGDICCLELHLMNASTILEPVLSGVHVMAGGGLSYARIFYDDEEGPYLSIAACSRLCLLRRMSALMAAHLSRADAAADRHAAKAELCRAVALLAYTLNMILLSLCWSCTDL